MAQTVSCRPLNAEARAQVTHSMWDLWWTKWHWDCFSSAFFGFPCQYNSTVTLHTHISSGGWTINPMVAAVQRHSRTPSTRATMSAMGHDHESLKFCYPLTYVYFPAWVLYVFFSVSLRALHPLCLIRFDFISVKALLWADTHHAGAWRERRYSSYSFSTLALHGGDWSALSPGRAIPRGKDPRYPFYRRLGGPQSRFGHNG
jgi:hypothetical protein